jgi:hypothetical protein
MGDVVFLPPKPTEWDEVMSVSLSANGQIFVTMHDGSAPTDAMGFTLSDVMKRTWEYRRDLK